jgi:hypothetical protein
MFLPTSESKSRTKHIAVKLIVEFSGLYLRIHRRENLKAHHPVISLSLQKGLRNCFACSDESVALTVGNFFNK